MVPGDSESCKKLLGLLYEEFHLVTRDSTHTGNVEPNGGTACRRVSIQISRLNIYGSCLLTGLQTRVLHTPLLI